MIQYEKYQLDNGLTVIQHCDTSSPMVVTSVAYDVGSRDEDPDHTGFAHLFEHLMFGGSAHAPNFDEPIQLAGGENNAFTNTDLTNFYDILPSANIETALWLEADRMESLLFSQRALDTQKSVVIEEFKETCLAEPYGDVWHHISDLVYQQHSYRWPTIGKHIGHIEHATLDQVQTFFAKHYAPSNAVLILSGNIDHDRTRDLVHKHFGDIAPGEKYIRDLIQEPAQKEYRQRTVKGNAPVPAIYLAFQMEGRSHADYYTYDLLSDALSNGRSSRLYQRLLKDRQLFSQIDAYISGTFDRGVLVIEGRPMPGVSIPEAKAAIWDELEQLRHLPIPDRELQKIQNKIESSLEYSEVSVMHKAMSLGYFEILQDANLINHEAAEYQKVTAADIQRIANKTFVQHNCSELLYLPSDD